MGNSSHLHPWAGDTGTRGCSVMLVWGAACGEGTPHGLGCVWSWSSHSCTPRLTSPSSLHPPHCHTHHVVHAPMMDPSSFHLLRFHFPPPPHQLPSILILCLPYSCISLGPTSSRKPSLIFQATSSQPFTVLWDSLHVCLSQQMGASPGCILGLIHLCVSNTKHGFLDPRATRCSSQATSLGAW